MKRSRMPLRALCEGAILIAMAEILSFLPLYKFPWGGSIDFAMLPIFVFCARWGFGPSLLVGFAHGFLQMMFEGGIAIGWESLLGDYIIAYAVLGFAGLFYKRKGGFFVGTVVGCVARFLVHYVVGATIWAETMPETFFNMTMTSPWIYSALYNGTYMLIDMVMILVVGALLYKVANKYMTGRDLAPYRQRNAG